MQNTIAQLEKLLQEAKKDAEKKANVIITRNNAIQQLESQLSNLEKRNNEKKFVEAKEVLQNEITCLNQQLNTVTIALAEKTDLLETTTNEVKIWIGKTEGLQLEIEELKSRLASGMLRF